MLTIRPEQLAAIEEARQRSLAKDWMGPLKELWPDACLGLSEADVHRVVVEGIRRARAYGLDRDSLVKRFLNLMFALGFDFDKNPAYPEAAAILKAAGLPAKTRMDQLATWAKGVLAAADRAATGPG